MRRNEKAWQFRVSERELVVGAGFLEAPVLYGIQSGFFTAWDESPGKKIRDTVREMEHQGLLLCCLDGTVYMKSEFLHCMECICSPQRLFRIRKGEWKVVWIYEKEGSAVLLEKENRCDWEMRLLKGREALRDYVEKERKDGSRMEEFGGEGRDGDNHSNCDRPERAVFPGFGGAGGLRGEKAQG